MTSHQKQKNSRHQTNSSIHKIIELAFKTNNGRGKTRGGSTSSGSTKKPS